MKKIVYVDMDGVLCDYIGYCNEHNLNPNDTDDICELFINLKPIPGAINGFRKLMEYYDVYVLSTAPWENETALSEKNAWIKKYLPEAYKRVIYSHNKHLCVGDYLIDDRLKNGSEKFTGELIHFGTDKYPDWDSVLKYLVKE
jgi:5'(3')-deoxyribonucleotidase